MRIGVCFRDRGTDLTLPAGPTTARMVAGTAQFEREILQEWVKARIAKAKEGRWEGPPRRARQLGISRTSVGRLLKASTAS